MRQVKVILSESVQGLGEAGDLVGVKVGYARNYLLPQGKALLATESKVRELEHHKRVVTEKAARDLNDLKALRDRLESVALEVTARVGEEGKLFGSVTTAHIAELLAEKGYKVDRRKIQLSEPLREIGDHIVPIRLQRDLTAEVSLKISDES
jgi:large subunit ribosomal protein L9